MPVGVSVRVGNATAIANPHPGSQRMPTLFHRSQDYVAAGSTFKAL